MAQEREPETMRLQPVPNDTPGRSSNNVFSASRDDEMEDYEPYDHRNVPAPTNNFETLVHLLKASLGTGILAMPQAFGKAGLVTAIIATVVIGIIVTHSLQILVKAQYAICKVQRVPLVDYRDAVRQSVLMGPQPLRPFGRPSAAVVDSFLVIYQLGVCVCYIVFIARTMKQLIDPAKDMSVQMHMLFILVPLLAFNLIPNLKYLAPFSLLANVLTLVGVAIVMYYLITRKTSDAPLDLWGSPGTFPLFFGTTLFALTAVGVVIAVENNMKTPRAFGTQCGVLNVAMSIIVAMYVAMGAIGYVSCVDKCEDSITLNLPPGGATTAVAIMYAIAIFISYALHCYVPVDIIWRCYLKPRLVRAGSGRLVLWEYVLRAVLCLLTFTLAVAIPRLGLFISLFGAMCLSALGICFPAVMDLCVRHPDKHGPGRLLFYKNIGLFVVGLIGLVAGTYTALRDIVLSFT